LTEGWILEQGDKNDEMGIVEAHLLLFSAEPIKQVCPLDSKIIHSNIRAYLMSMLVP
jgi:hypothetical protein